MRRDIVAVFKLNGNKYSIEGDAMVDIEMVSGAKYTNMRVIGMGRSGNTIKAIGKDGMNELPIATIKTITDSGKPEFSRIRIS